MNVNEYRKRLAAITNDELASDIEKDYAREQLKVLDEAEKRQSPFLKAYIKNCMKCEEDRYDKN